MAASIARFLRGGVIFFALSGLLFFFGGLKLIVSHQEHMPNYDRHTNHTVHDECHEVAYVYTVLLLWYVVYVMLIVSNREAKQSRWALSLLGIPSMFLLAANLIVFGYLVYTYNDHDEHFFAAALYFGSGITTVVLSYFFYSFVQNTIVEPRAYGYPWFLVTAFMFGATTIVQYVNSGAFSLPTIAMICGFSATAWGTITLSFKSNKIMKEAKYRVE